MCSNGFTDIFLKHQGPLGDLWYIGCPHATDKPDLFQRRLADVEECVIQLIGSWDRVVPIAPVLYTRSFEMNVSPEDGWYRFCLALLKQCHVMVVLQLEGWDQSIGLGLEISYALDHGIPIHYFTKERLLDKEDIPF